MIVSAARFCIAASRLRLPPTKGFGTARRGGQGRPDLHGDVADCCQLRTAPQRRLTPMPGSWCGIYPLGSRLLMFMLLRTLVYLSPMAVMGGWLLVGLFAGPP